MAEVSCCAGPNEVLRAILLTLNDLEASLIAASVQSGSQPIPIGVDTVTVVFPTAFAVAPVVLGTISRPVAEGLIEVNIDQASITTTGFTASLSATTPSANYVLNWMAQ